MGINVWVPRQDHEARTSLAEAEDSVENDEPKFSRERQDIMAEDSAPPDEPHANGKRESGEPVESAVPVAQVKAADQSKPRDNASASTDEMASLDWDALEKRVAGCTLCGLQTTRTQTVFGVGSHTADWLFIGEAPGRDEDAQGEPFVGRAGQLLNNMLKAIGLSREQVYIANVLKCRPPKNRDPKPEEASCCEPYLKRQIDLLKPKIIIALGRIAAQNLLRTDTPIGKMRGKQYVYADTGIPMLVTYHPAYLLRSPLEKRKVWEDLLRAKKLVQSD